MSRNGPAAGLTSSAETVGGNGASAETVGGNGASAGRRALVVGGGHAGRTVASHLSDEYDVTFVSTALEAVERVDDAEIRARHADDIDASALDAVGADGTSLAVVASRADGRNLLAAQLLRTTFDVERVVMLVNDPDRLDPLLSLDVEALCVPDLLATGVRDHLQRLANETDEN